jgi:hypothetical protein
MIWGARLESWACEGFVWAESVLQTYISATQILKLNIEIDGCPYAELTFTTLVTG